MYMLAIESCEISMTELQILYNDNSTFEFEPNESLTMRSQVSEWSLKIISIGKKFYVLRSCIWSTYVPRYIFVSYIWAYLSNQSKCKQNEIG